VEELGGNNIIKEIKVFKKKFSKNYNQEKK